MAMTYQEVIDIVDDLRPNAYDDETKLRWLGHLDDQIWKDFMIGFEGMKGMYITGQLPKATDFVLIDDSYAEDIYVPYLQSRIDRENGETVKFNQSVTIYNAAMQGWKQQFTRTHRARMPDHFMF